MSHNFAAFYCNNKPMVRLISAEIDGPNFSISVSEMIENITGNDHADWGLIVAKDEEDALATVKKLEGFWPLNQAANHPWASVCIAPPEYLEPHHLPRRPEDFRPHSCADKIVLDSH